MKSVLLFILIPFSLFANSCKLDYKILYSVAMVEGLENRKGYEYIISFNDSIEAEVVRETKYMKQFFVNKRTLDCKNVELCEVILDKLVANGITNLDLGAYQINYYYHKLPFKEYFNFDKSYDWACGYITSLINEFGYNWYAIASYHSKTESLNLKYQEQLISVYRRL